MRRTAEFIIAAALAALIAGGCSTSNQMPADRGTGSPSKPASQPIPPYREKINVGEVLPQVLAPDVFRDTPAIAEVYRVAARIPGVLAQQPCYCYCDKLGHGSLLDCFATDHGAG